MSLDHIEMPGHCVSVHFYPLLRCRRQCPDYFGPPLPFGLSQCQSLSFPFCQEPQTTGFSLCRYSFSFFLMFCKRLTYWPKGVFLTYAVCVSVSSAIQSAIFLSSWWHSCSSMCKPPDNGWEWVIYGVGSLCLSFTSYDIENTTKGILRFLVCTLINLDRHRLIMITIAGRPASEFLGLHK